MPQLTVTTAALPSGTVVDVSGELDHRTASQVRALLPGLAIEPGQQLLIDLGGLTFCDSTGITLLIAARNHALAARGSIALIAVPDRVRRILDLVGLGRVFPAYPTVQDAEEAWTAAPAG